MKNRCRRGSRPPLFRLYPVLIVLLLFAAAGVRSVAASGTPPQAEPHAYVPGEVILGWEPEGGAVPRGAPPKGFHTERTSADWQAAAQTLEARTGLPVLDTEPYYGVARLSAPPGQEQAEIARLSALPWVKYAEPNYIAYAADTYPNDPDIGRQWNMRRVYAPAAWDVTFGSYSMVVAVVDSGIDLNHSEFAGRILLGYDYVRNDYVPDDENDHGTHVSGIIAAAANNWIGVAGLAPNVKILPLKVLDSTGSGSYYNIGLAIRTAADSSAQIINLSQQGLAPSDALHDAVIYAANDRGRLAVAAAGNYGNVGNPEVYPAAYSEAFSVAASDHYDNWASYSTYNDHVDLAAPGGTSGDQIWSTVRLSQGGYGYEYGTSMAAPLASAAAALVWTYLPAAQRLEITNILKETADKVGAYPYVGGRNPYFGYGRLNIGRAVRRAYPPSLSPDLSGAQAFLLGGPLQQASGKVAVLNPSEQSLAWNAGVVQGSDWLSLSTFSGAASFSSPGSISFGVGPSLPPPGKYEGRIRVTYNGGASSFDIPVQLQVAATLSRTFLPLATNGYLAASWYDPLPGSQPLYLPNNSLAQVSLPFPVSFYGGVYASSIWVSDDGIALLSYPTSPITFSSANCMPSAARPNNALYVLWQDWVPELGGNVYVHQPNNDTFVITWDQVVRAGNPVPHSFQLVLTGDGRVLFQYRSVGSPLAGTIGVENFDGTLAQQILCNGAGRQVGDGEALLMNPAVPW